MEKVLLLRPGEFVALSSLNADSVQLIVLSERPYVKKLPLPPVAARAPSIVPRVSSIAKKVIEHIFNAFTTMAVSHNSSLSQSRGELDPATQDSGDSPYSVDLSGRARSTWALGPSIMDIDIPKIKHNL